MKLQDLSQITKKERNFDAEVYLAQKIQKINDFFRLNNLDSAIIGLSGGVDSSLVFALLIQASNQLDSPIKKIVGITMPIFNNGTTNQNIALERAMLLKSLNTSKTEIINVDLTETFRSYVNASFKNKSIFSPSSWSHGQLASIVRTPCLYHHAAMLQANGFNSIVVGTTNRDEGSYIGFFGKASDAMVDLQPIADIHKSEVYEISKLLNIPQEIIDAVPTGDVHDGKVDEEMIGAPYWFLELYILMKEYRLMHLVNSLSQEEQNAFKVYSDNIENLHKKNSHKYFVEYNDYNEEIIKPRGFSYYVDIFDHAIIIYENEL